MLLCKQQCLIIGLSILIICFVKLSHANLRPKSYIENDKAQQNLQDSLLEIEDDQGDEHNDDDINKRNLIETIAATHPLDPLTAFEMRLVGVIVKLYNNSAAWQFKFIGLREPDKAAYYPYFLSRTDPPAGLIPRRANVLVCDPVIRRPIWVIVNLSTFKVDSWEEQRAGEKIPDFSFEDVDLVGNLALSDANVLKRINALGYNGISDVIPDIWDASYISVADNSIYAAAPKLYAVYFYGNRGNGTNIYSHPFDFVVYVQLGVNKILGIEDLPIHQTFDGTNRTGNSVPSKEYPYSPNKLPPNSLNTGLHPLKISQPDGPSFKISGRSVTWQNFQFRVGYNPREGGYIYTVTFNDKGVIRPIVYRMSISDMYLRYGDPRPPYHRKSAFEVSNPELGGSITILPVHQFCRGEAYYFPSDHHNEKPDTWIKQNSICVVEEDAGILSTHYDSVSGETVVTRNQRLSVSFHVSIGNTDYWISYHFLQDATIDLAIKVTGIASTNLMAVDVKAPPYGKLMAPQIYTQIHQLFFAVRVDLDVDGRNNTVAVEDIVNVSETVSPTENPYGNGLRVSSTVLKTAGQSRTNSLVTRTWRVFNAGTEEPVNGKPRGYRLIPQGDSPTLKNLMTPNSPVRKRVPWANYNMWVTPYNPDQIFIGGFYLDDGVDLWTSGANAMKSIENTDIVLWHVFSIVHAPEVEDWPIVSGCPGTSSFRLRPSGFFNQNPVIYSPSAEETTAYDGGWNGTIAVTQPIEIQPVEGPGWPGF